MTQRPPAAGDVSNNFQYTQQGMSLFAVNPYAGLIGTGAGLIADTAATQSRQDSAMNATRQYNQNLVESRPNVYAGGNAKPSGGGWYADQMPSFGRGGRMLRYAKGGHIIPAENAGKAVKDGKRVGVDLTRPVAMKGETMGGTVPGNGNPRADDKVMQPAGTQPARVSSGEVYVNDDLFERMARSIGMGVAAYQKTMYPNADQNGRANGGPIDPPKKGSPDRQIAAEGELHNDYYLKEALDLGYKPNAQNHLPSRNYKTGHVLKGSAYPTFQMGIDEDRELGYQPMVGPDGKIYTINPDDLPQEGPFAPVHRAQGGPLGGGDQDINSLYASMVQGGGFLQRPIAGPREDNMTMDDDTLDIEPISQRTIVDHQLDLDGDGLDDSSNATGNYLNGLTDAQKADLAEPGSKVGEMRDQKKLDASYEDQERLNRNDAITKAVPMVGALAYNIFRQREPGKAPEAYVPTKVDLGVSALRSQLDADRKLNKAGAVYNTRDKQGVGRDLAIVAGDMEARRKNSVTVQGVQNQESMANTQIENQARQYNTGTTNEFTAIEAGRQDRFAEQKMGYTNMALQSLNDIYGGYMQNKVNIGAMKQADNYQRRWLKYFGGARGTKNWTPETVQFGQ